jgi:hypothetical protein
MSTRMPVGGRLRSSPRAGVCRGLAAPVARAGEAAPRPYKTGQSIAGRVHGHHGGAVSRSCRGQAVPDPPARQGRQIDAKGCGGVSTIAAGAVGSERPGLKPRAQSASPLKGAVRRPGRLGRSAGCRRRVDQPAPAGLGTEPGRSRPGDRGEGRSADLRCVSCETCRPRGIAAPIGGVGRGSASPLQGGRSHSRRAYGRHGGAASPPR